MVMASLVPRYTAAEVRKFPDGGLRYEVIRGELFVSPAPGTPHQRIVGELFARLHRYVGAQRVGEVLPGPFEIVFAKDTAVQPDILVIPNERAGQLTAKRLYRTDRLQKCELYRAEGVDEYWIVDPDLRRVERWRSGSEVPELLTERLVWSPKAGVPSLVISLKPLFRAARAGLEPRPRRSRLKR